MRFLALIRFALSHANTSAEMITPTITAKARLRKKIVTKVTTTITNTSDFGILLKVRKLAHSKVVTATIIINPVRAAIGSCSIIPEPNMINISKATAATIPDKRALAPEETLIKLCPIIAHPPIPEKRPDSILAVPCATASLLLFPRVSVISSKMLSVNKLSINPTDAMIAA